MAWFEYEEFGDAVVFTQIATSRAGFENALALLPRDPDSPRRRLASSLPGLDIRLHSHRQQGQRFDAFVARPQTRHGRLLSETLFSLGVRGTELVNDATFDEGLDLVVISGHGSDGEVWGTNTGVDARTDLVRGIAKGITNPRSTRTKVLIVASCTNINDRLARFWLPAFNHESPVHLVLGYESGYAGGVIGARVLGRFAEKLVRFPQEPIVDLWRSANTPNRQPWAAIAAKGAEGMTLDTWARRATPNLKNVAHLSFFDESSPTGVPVRLGNDRFELTWVVEDLVVTPENSGSENPEIGLANGKRGEIRIRATNARDRFEAGEQGHLFIYRYRPELPIDPTALLEFDSETQGPQPATAQPVIQLDPRPRDDLAESASQNCSYLITFASDANEIRLPSRVRKNATDAFPADGPGGTHGRFKLLFLAPGQWEHKNGSIVVKTISVPVIGVHLRP